jgi:hypothetical protein
VVLYARSIFKDILRSLSRNKRHSNFKIMVWWLELLIRNNTQITKLKFAHVIKKSWTRDSNFTQNFHRIFEHHFYSLAETDKAERKVALSPYMLICILNRNSDSLVCLVYNSNFIKASYVPLHLIIFLSNKYIKLINTMCRMYV